MTATLTILNHLNYIIECVALDYLGEAKSSLTDLCKHLESDSSEYAIENRKLMASQLHAVLEAYRHGDNTAAISLLVQINRSLWHRHTKTIID
jgi:hypothetical protein